MTNVYKSFYKTVGGNEGNKCYYPTRLDTYGKGCAFDCKYCYAKSILNFRKYWHPDNVSISPIGEIRKTIAKKINSGDVVRLGGMTDCFQPIELKERVTYETIKALNMKRVHYLIVTKSDIICRPEYLDILDNELAHIQISIPSSDNDILNKLDNAPSFERRKRAIETLDSQGYDVCIRLAPFLYDYIDIDKINDIKCDKILVEFLRVNSWIEKAMKDMINISDFSVKQSNYKHMSLEHKLELLKQIDKPQITVCDDVDEHYGYFRDNVNYNPNDCCNLKFNHDDDGVITSDNF